MVVLNVWFIVTTFVLKLRPQGLAVIDHKSHTVVHYLLCVPLQFNKRHRHVDEASYYSGCEYDCNCWTSTT